ncbi:MAG: hypothetical protein ABI806_24815 [Candidatus Solibacter sp.]
MRYEAQGNGAYRVFGPDFHADVHMCWTGVEWVCSVDRCSNVMVNAWDIQLWCVANIE